MKAEAMELALTMSSQAGLKLELQPCYLELSY
jgi:hypothetical protein